MTEEMKKVADAATSATREDSSSTYNQNRESQSTTARRVTRITIPNSIDPGRPMTATKYYDGFASLSLGLDQLAAVRILLTPEQVAELVDLLTGGAQ
ncbi:hypothetical protein JS533_009045 [Bifidobacterium amazonense]|uniref:Uncharacterized protein n=1 Tax=Bifidobacterium amazonense TaxID=2809027 RepID=A0ABS9VX67_9BIFI|nr:hypothetical protein [Bifidobacterium amazonense]MCH9276410.1 hypothetical protein [Bifidobacterium amazonense]